MNAIVRKSRIDIEGANGVPNDKWEPLLDDLKAVHVPSLNPSNKRVTIVVNNKGRFDAFIYRVSEMSDADVIAVFRNYGIDACTSPELAQGANT